MISSETGARRETSLLVFFELCGPQVIRGPLSTEYDTTRIWGSGI